MAQKVAETGGTKPPKPTQRPYQEARAPKTGRPEHRPDYPSPKQGPKTGQTPITDPAQVLAIAQQSQHVLVPRIEAITGVKMTVLTGIRWGDPAQMDNKAMAWAKSDGVIEVNPTYTVGMTEDQIQSLMAHELTHQVLRDVTWPEGRPALFVEGLADYVRDAVFQRSGQAEAQSVSIPGNSTASGYQVGAAFFQDLEADHPGAVKNIIQLMRLGDKTAVEDATGAPLGDLIYAYEQDVQRRQNPPDPHIKIGPTPWRDIFKEARKPGVNWSQAYDRWWNSTWNEKYAEYEDSLPQAPEPSHLGPHYAAGPNPGLSSFMGGSSPPGLITQTLPQGIIGLEPAPMAASAASVPQPEFQQGAARSDPLPWGEAAQVNDLVGLVPPPDEQQFKPAGPQEDFLYSQSDRPQEPFTQGLPFGPGRGPEMTVADPKTEIDRIAQAALQDPGAPKELKQFARRVQQGM